MLRVNVRLCRKVVDLEEIEVDGCPGVEGRRCSRWCCANFPRSHQHRVMERDQDSKGVLLGAIRLHGLENDVLDFGSVAEDGIGDVEGVNVCVVVSVCGMVKVFGDL